MSQYAIQSTTLGKRFGQVWAVQNLHLAVPAGAIYGFLGPNGAGKTTTIRLMLGLLRPSSGAIHVYGQDVVHNRLAASGMIGALLDAKATYDHLSGYENLDITRRLLGLGPRQTHRVLEYVSLTKDAHRKVGHYSLGMRQRLGLARALLGSPKLLVLDEPMNGLDPDGMHDMRAVIRNLPASTGATVFLSSHLLAEVEQIATDIGMMHNGRLVLQGGIQDVLAHVPTNLHIRAANIDQARACLASYGHVGTYGPGTLVLPLKGGDQEAAQINRHLLQAEVNVIELTHQRGSLETLYMQLTQHETALTAKAA